MHHRSTSASSLARASLAALSFLCAWSARAQDAAPPAEPPQAAPPAPAAPAEPAAPAPDPVDRCVAMLATGSAAEGRACLVDVEQQAPGSPAAVRARALLDMLAIQGATQAPPTPAPAPSTEPPAPPAPAAPPDEADTLGRLDLTPSFGRVELSVASAGLGVYTGIVGGAVGGLVLSDLSVNPGVLILSTGVAATTLGLAGGVTGYILGDDDVFGESGARLGTLGTVFGAVAGIPLAMTTAEIFMRLNPSADLAYAKVVAAGVGATLIGAPTVGLASGLLLSRATDVDGDAVTLMTAGTLLGSGLGLLAMPNYAAWGVGTTWPYSLTFVGLGLGGAAAGYGLSRVWDVPAIDSMLGVGGALLGASVLGFTTLAAAAPLGVTDPRASTALVTGSTAVGMLGGFAAVVVPLHFLRATYGAPDASSTGLDLRPGGVPIVALDQNGQLVAMAPLLSGRF